LTRHRVPKSRGSTKPGWHHQVVTRLLGNSKYVGIWPWGVVRGRRNPLTGQALRDHRSAEEREKWTRNLPELQIVEREIFEQAQKLLRENRKHVKPGGGGMFSRHRKDRAQTAPQHLLAGLLVCGECGHRLYAGGSRAKYLFCPNYQRGTCTCQTTVARALAEELILRPISKQLLSNSAWFNEVLNSTLASWRRQQAQLPNALKSAETAINEAERRIRRLVDALEDDESDSGEIRARLQERRAELETLKSRRDRLSASVGAVPAEPTAEWLLSKLQNLTKILHSATPAAAFSLRDLVGGQVVVTEVKRPGKQRHFLRGRFVLRDGAITALLRLPDDGSNAAEEAGEVVEIDFVRINPLNAKAEEVKELYDQGLLNVVIAEKLGCSKAQVTKLLKHWSKVHDVTLPCGYSRRSQLTQKTAQPTMCQKHAE